ncbi:MAG: ABC transporter ATP-binding protein [Pseudomonadota bacterium]
MHDGQSVLRAEGVGKQVEGPEGTLEILSEITLQIAPSESVALVGPSGAGKSTLLAVLAGLDTPTAGEVWLGDQAITSLSEDARAQLRNARVGFVFQSFHLLPSLTAVENVMLPAELAGSAGARERALDALKAVDLTHRARHYPKHLSGGERQRVAIARAFVTEPQLLFADEPTGNLDTRTGQRVADLLFRLQHEAGVTLVLVTHDDRLAQRCDRVLRLAEGRLTEADT